MGYRVYYGPIREHHSRPRIKWPFFGMVFIFFALFCALAQHYLRQELVMLYQILLPSIPMETLIERLQDGENIVESVAAFCEDILHGH